MEIKKDFKAVLMTFGVVAIVLGFGASIYHEQREDSSMFNADDIQPQTAQDVTEDVSGIEIHEEEIILLATSTTPEPIEPPVTTPEPVVVPVTVKPVTTTVPPPTTITPPPTVTVTPTPTPTSTTTKKTTTVKPSRKSHAS